MWSCAHWLSWRCGIAPHTAREHVRVARALQDLPALRNGFANGTLSYSKVRAATRVADRSTDAQLAEFAQHATGAQLERIVRGYRGALEASREHAKVQNEKQYLNWSWDESGMLRLRGALTPEDGAAFLAALASAEEQVPQEVTDRFGAGARHAQGLTLLATRSEAGDAAPCELTVHVDAVTLAAEHVNERSEVESGPTIAPELARRLGCDAAVVTIIEREGRPLSVGRRTRAIPPALRRALRSRDHGGCRFPGCTHTRHLHAHHITHWAHGGATDIDNLVQLCSLHHRLVHEGGYRVSRTNGRIRFESPTGWEIPERCAAGVARGPSIEQRNHRRGVVVDARTCVPKSGGDRCDYSIAVEGLCSLAERGESRAP